MASGTTGSQLITADGVAGVEDKALRLFSAHLINGAGGAAVVNLRNGDAATDTEWIRLNGSAASAGNHFDFGDTGVLFPDGLFVDVDTNTVSVLINYRVEQA